MVNSVQFRSQAEITADNRKKRTGILAQLDERSDAKMNVKIRKLHADAVIPRYATDGAAGFDLVAVEDVIIAPGETKLVRTGLAFEIPDGYALYVCMRSGIALRTKLRLANGIGVVDADYRGEVAVILENIRQPSGDEFRDSTELAEMICRGDRIAQGIIAPVERAVFVEVAELGETERGDGGFGSTGVGSI